ncbi:hypothetical protein PRIPAC_85125 [Pristionchus pacificus]|uniref:Uncharacterized protein n=1 Tax=Pristionchus pacificus TaxID=54126 RepID=A0A454XZ82_PRIPA|nr:hypothetical protein PRIPAC_85125 [Pristionchus pacificus]|eukprot:PDM68823.1 hypothetical protein PRIPAC_47125 [Pristionchus pacificus]
MAYCGLSHNSLFVPRWLRSRCCGRVQNGLVCDSSTKKWQWSDGSSLNYKPPSSSGYDSDCDTFPTTRYDIYCIVELQQPIPSGDGCNSFEDDKDDGVCYQVLMLEANKCCDNVIIYENSIGNNVIANLTGELNHQKYMTTSSNIMRVSWKPNGGVNVQGLAFTFNAV